MDWEGLAEEEKDPANDTLQVQEMLLTLRK